jgi:transposase
LVGIVLGRAEAVFFPAATAGRRRVVGSGRAVAAAAPAVAGRTGRPRVEDRRALEGILFVLTTGVGWGKLPAELGCGSGVTCWRRLREWHEAGVWSRLHQAVLDRLGRQGLLDWSRTALDSVSVRAKRGAS